MALDTQARRGSLSRWRRRASRCLAASALLMGSWGASFVPPTATVRQRCMESHLWRDAGAGRVLQAGVMPSRRASFHSPSRLWLSSSSSSRRDVDVLGSSNSSSNSKSDLLQSLRTSANEEEVNKAVNILLEEKVGASLTLKDYTTVLTALKRVKNWKKALDLLSSMRARQGLEPNAITYNVVMGACGVAGRWKEALDLFYAMQSAGFRPDAVTFGSLMNAFVRAGLWERALDVMATAKDKGIELSEGFYTAGLVACEKGGQWALALELLKEMHLVGFQPTTFAYNAAIFSCRRDKQWVQAIALLGEMRQDGRTADRNSYHGAIAACEEAEKWEAVMDLFEELKQSGIEPSRQSYEYVVRACKEYRYLNGMNEDLVDYLKRNNISPNVVENDDGREVLLLHGAKLLEQVRDDDDLDDQPSWLSFAEDDDE